MINAINKTPVLPGNIFLSVINENGVITSANSLMQEKFNLRISENEINFYELIHPVYLDEFRDFVNQKSKGRNSGEIELYIRNGSWHLMRWHVDYLPELSNNQKRYLCYGYEVAKDNNKKPAGKDNITKTVFEAFLKQTSHLSWIVDEEANLVFANEAFYKYFGKDTKECVNKPMTEVVPLTVMQVMYALHNKVLHTQLPIETTEKVKLADGTDLVSYINIFPLGDISGKKLLAGQAIHLPDKSKLEEELHDAHERFLNLSKATSDAIWEWDMQSGKVFQNEKLLEMIGYRLDGFKGLAWWLRRIHPQDRNRVADKLKEATEQHQQSWQNEYRFKFADDSYRNVQDKGFIIYDNGLPVKMICSLHEISHLKDIQDKLADEKIKTEKEAAATINHVHERERTRIGYDLQNSINQLLSTAGLYLDSMNTDNKEQEQAKQKSKEYIQMTIDEIRKLSKELATPMIKEAGFAGIINNLIAEVGVSGILDIQVIHDDGIEQLSSSVKITLFRIIQEQLKNVVEHSHASVCSIVFQVNDDNVRLVIEDNGNGFDPHQTHRGIGLSNIRGRISFFNGSLTIRSSQGKGCSLIVTIPK